MFVKPTIYLDLDGMAVNLLAKLLEFYNAEHGTSFTSDALWLHKSKHRPSDLIGDSLDHYLFHDNVFEDLEPLPGFMEVLPRLKGMADICVASAPSRNPDSASSKIRWVLKHLKLHRSKIALLKEKWRLAFNPHALFLEDWHTNIEEIRTVSPRAFIGAIAYPYNESKKDLLTVRAEGYLDTARAWNTLADGIEDFLRKPVDKRIIT